MAALSTGHSWCAFELVKVTVLWWFKRRSDSNFDVVGLLHRQSKGGMNCFVTEAASVINRRVAQEDQALPKKTIRRVCESFVWSPRKSVSKSS
jgi:hypothetical protein